MELHALVSPQKCLDTPGQSKVSPCGRAPAPFGADGCSHTLIPLKVAIGPELWKPGKQERCVDCNGFTAWVCAECSNGPGSLVAVCPEITKPTKGKDKGTTVRHFCLAHHCANPNVFRCGKAPDACRRKRLRFVESTDAPETP